MGYTRVLVLKPHFATSQKSIDDRVDAHKFALHSPARRNVPSAGLIG